jgi:hypothetical protein
MANIVHAPDIQSSMISDLIGNIAASGMNATPTMPDAKVVQAEQPQQQPDLLSKLKSDSGNSSITKTNNDVVTRAIANTGQLIPMQPAGATSGGSGDTDKILKAIQAMAGGNPASSGDSGSSGGGKSSGGGIIGDILDVATSFLSWIICTELVRQGRLNKRWYYAGAKTFAAYPDYVKEGYYLWAIRCVSHLRRSPNSWFSCFLSLIFNWRAENIAAHYGVKGARYLIRGQIVTCVLWPTCWVLGFGLALLGKKQNWQQVYGEKA